MKIKASTITNLTDARYFAAKEVDYLGFNLEPGTTGFLEPIYMRAMREWIEGPKIVGEFSKSPANVVFESAAFFGLDAVQVSASKFENMLSGFSGLEVLLEIPIERGFSKKELQKRLEFLSPEVSQFVFKFSGEEFSWVEIELDLDFWFEICSKFPVLFDFDVQPEQVNLLVEKLPGVGLCLRGGEEERVGVKSFEELEAIFDEIETIEIK